MKKPINRNLLKVAILCVAMQDIGAGAATPALAAIMAAFPTVNPSIIQMVLTVPALFIVIFSPIYAKLTQYLAKRKILYIATLGFLIGGIGPLFMNSIYMILVMRALLGASVGFLLPMGNDLIVDFFEGDERKVMLGWVFAVSSIGGVMFQMVGGYLAGIDWHYTFYAYLCSILFFAIPILFLPEPERKSTPEQGHTKVKAKLTGEAWSIAVMAVLWGLFFTPFVTNAAIIIVGDHLGTSGQVGLAFSFLTISGFLAASVFGKLTQWFKGKTFLVSAFFFTAVGLTMLYYAQSFVMACASAFVTGIGMGLVNPALVAKVTDLSSHEAAPLAIASVVGGIYLGQFFQPIIFTSFGTGRYPVLVGIIGMLICMVIMFFVDRATKKSMKPSSSPTEG